MPTNLPSQDMPLDAWFNPQECVVTPLGAGHINRTFLVQVQGGEYVLQELSQAVFQNPQQVLMNQQAVLAAAARSDWFDYDLPALLPTRKNEPWQRSGKSYWRLSPHIQPATSLPRVTRPEQARAAGRAFARYQHLLAGLQAPPSAPPIKSVITNFHQLAHYLDLSLIHI